MRRIQDGCYEEERVDLREDTVLSGSFKNVFIITSRGRYDPKHGCYPDSFIRRLKFKEVEIPSI